MATLDDKVESKAIYLTSSDNTARFVLGATGTRNIIVIGVNPSTATDVQDDRTVLRVKAISSLRGYDGWILINLYPLRAPNFDNMPQNFDTSLHESNLGVILNTVKQFPGCDVWAAWGNQIGEREYLRQCLTDIASAIRFETGNWLQAGTLTKECNPRHPLYLSGNAEFSAFDLGRYLGGPISLTSAESD
jgi:hypothetical protein